ncbi:MAG: DUF1080 domain-containing protein [Planctomycetaceae bacterium]
MTVRPLLVLLLLVSVPRAVTAADAAPEFVPLFDGATLTGWQAADPSYWSVEERAITGRITPDHPSARNHYLVWQGGEIGDFELRLRHRIVSDQPVNGGFQFRSRMFDGQIPADCRGYQVDNNTRTPWLVRLYDEFGRHTLAMRGERAVYDAAGTRTVAPLPGVAKEPHFRLEDWHEYILTCRGTTIALSVDGQPVAEVVDDDPAERDLRGILALQLHSGPPMTVQFKDIRLRRLE